MRVRDAEGRQRQAFARGLAEARRLRSELTAEVSRGEVPPGDTHVGCGVRRIVARAQIHCPTGRHECVAKPFLQLF